LLCRCFKITGNRDKINIDIRVTTTSAKEIDRLCEQINKLVPKVGPSWRANIATARHIMVQAMSWGTSVAVLVGVLE
jgi:hypothetical protein